MKIDRLCSPHRWQATDETGRPPKDPLGGLAVTSRKAMDPVDLKTLQREVETAKARGTVDDARALIAWAHELLGDQLMMSTAFGKSGMVILHMVRDIAPRLPVYFLNTGFHFPETLNYAEELRRKWKLNLILREPKLFGDAFKARYGEQPYRTNPDFCCHKNKVEPFAEILGEYRGWISGVRRDQGLSRAQAEALEILEGGKLKVQPLVAWRREQVDRYVEEHEIPLHPLFGEGYTSIGCAPCTQRPTHPGDERSGRWAGIAKRECGLHTTWKEKKTDAAEKEDEGAEETGLRRAAE
jgi:phosphoadenosine phosphosulfate reductase